MTILRLCGRTVSSCVEAGTRIRTALAGLSFRLVFCGHTGLGVGIQWRKMRRSKSRLRYPRRQSHLKRARIWQKAYMAARIADTCMRICGSMRSEIRSRHQRVAQQSAEWARMFSITENGHVQSGDYRTSSCPDVGLASKAV